MRFIRLAPVLALLLFAANAWSLDFSPLEKVPIQESGRKKPYIVFAEESTLALTGRTSVKVDDKSYSAMAFITTLWLNPTGWEAKPVILVNHKPLKEATGLDIGRKLFSYDELVDNPRLREILNEAAALRAKPGAPKLSGLPKDAADVGMRLAEFEGLTSGEIFRFVANPQLSEGPWSPAAPALIAPLRQAFLADNSAALAQASATFASEMAKIQPRFQPLGWKIDLETLYQKSHPIRWAWILYAVAGILLMVAGGKTGGYAIAWFLVGAGFIFQIFGFVARVLISGRAPVTNMYESVIWVAFGTILFAFIFEAIYRSRYFFLGAIPVAVVSLILADSQPVALSRSINPLVPVLRDNFWLTTHVLTITLSYAAFALALGVGHIILVRAIRGSQPSTPLYNYLYRTLQVGVLLLAIGTILGGVWANYSWGRFWDWDPKETWALITLLGYLFLLHGRIAGKWGGFGLAIGAVVCFLCVLMAWYGVNFVLGAGLHSYGFGSGGFGYAVAFVAVELVFVAIAVIRNRTLAARRRQSPTVTGVPSFTR